MKKLLMCGLLLMLFFSHCKDDDKKEEELEVEKSTIVNISTSFGEIKVYLYENTPLHKENFLKLADSGFYNQSEFHRIIPDFVIQGGDPLSKDEDRTNDGQGGPGYTIPAEIDTTLYKHKYGALAAARLGDDVNPERRSSGSQFYIVVDTLGEDFLDGNYTVFGEVLEGMNIADSIAGMPRSFGNNRPIDRIKMEVTLEEITNIEFEKAFGFAPIK